LIIGIKESIRNYIMLLSMN